MMYANVVLRDSLGDDLHEDALVENPIYPPVGAIVVIRGQDYVVERIEFDYDVFKDEAYTRVGIIVHVGMVVRRNR